MQVYEAFASKYLERGYITIPAKGKKPAIPKGWNRWHTERPSEQVIEEWTRLDSTGISMMCGPVNGLVGLDVDTDKKEIIQAIEASVPASPIVKKGAKGFTAFYRFKFKGDEPTEHKFKVGGEHVAELLIKKHTILPPSPHPDKKHHYQWLSDTHFLDEMFEPDDLPYLTMEHVACVDAALSALSSALPTSIIIKGGGKGGRNHYLSSVAASLMRGHVPFMEAIQTLLHEDKKMHKNNAFFEDVSDPQNCKVPWLNAYRFYMSQYTSAQFRRAKAGEPVEFPSDAQVLQRNVLTSDSMETGFFKPNDKGKLVHPQFYELAHFMVAKHHIYSGDGYVRFWDNNHYKNLSDRRISHLVDEYTLEHIKGMNQKNMFVRTVIDDAYDREKILLSSEGFINLANGIFDLNRKILSEHDPIYHFRYVLGYAYDAKARCPRFLRFLSDVFEGDRQTIALIREFIAYTIMGGHPFLHKSLCLVGTGRNGKSTLIEIVKALLGHENVSSVSLSHINEPFHAVGLDGKLANLVEESPTDVINPEVFKNIIGGGAIAMSKKYQDVYRQPCHARFIFATNDTPRFKDTSAGLHERIVMVNFGRYFKESEREANLALKIIDSELPGILNWVLELLPMREGFKLTIPEASKQLKDEFIEESNSVVAWFNECIEFNPYRKAEYLTNKTMFIHYNRWCGEQGIRNAVKNNTFGKRLKEHMKNVISDTKLDINDVILHGRSERGVKNIRFKG